MQMRDDEHFDTDAIDEDVDSMMKFSGKALVCLMLSSKMQSRDCHLLSSNVRHMV